MLRTQRLFVRRSVRSFTTSHIPPPLTVDVKMSDFHYHLPESNIAKYPAHPRGSSKLLVIRQRSNEGPKEEQERLHLSDSVFSSLQESLPMNTHLVFNESRVFSARVYATDTSTNETPSKLTEILFLNPEAPFQDPSMALSAPCTNQIWRCMIRKHYREIGGSLQFNVPHGNDNNNTGMIIRAEIVQIHSEWQEEDEDDGIEANILLTIVSTSSSSSSSSTITPTLLSLGDILSRCGEVPLPPYLNRRAEQDDVQAYQNVFASNEAAGSVAAPTAGLHFTDQLLQQLQQVHGVQCSTIRLHVSAATFRPVTATMVSEHDMHAERFEISKQQLLDLIASLEDHRVIIPVGTTSSRLLESLYWLGVKDWLRSTNSLSSSKHERPNHDNDSTLSMPLSLSQWEAYQLGATLIPLPCTPIVALKQLLQRMKSTTTTHGDKLFGLTSLCIVPGYNFAIIQHGLITNFHQPDSTLLLLVAAFMNDKKGKQLLYVYQHAIKQSYKFLSYGDACLFLKNLE